MSNATTFNHIIETASQLPLEQQEMLIEILHKRGIEQRRTAIATAAQQSIALFYAGELPAQSAAAVIADLHQQAFPHFSVSTINFKQSI